MKLHPDVSDMLIRAKQPLRQILPYGLWTLADGRQVLFNRGYKPIWERMPGEKATAADPDWWVPWSKQQWLFGDSSAPWLLTCPGYPLDFYLRAKWAEARCKR
jgi:hypothetical protein